MFKKAERVQAYLKLALAGPSGSGKTYSGLRIAKGLAEKVGSRIAVIDTENRSAALYADRFDFDLCELEPPFSTQKYAQAIAAAIQANYRVILVDSISHQWAGEGGILDRKARMDAGGGNSFSNWGKLTPEQESFRSLILQSDAHLIATMRSKQEYAIEQEGGKTRIQKLGMAPIQREGMEYEFTTVFEIDMAHQGQVSKDRTGLFQGFHAQLTEKVGEQIYDWWASGKQAAPQKPGLKCQFEGCGADMVLHKTGVGYHCEKVPHPDQKHTRFPVAELSNHMKAVQPQPATAGE